KPLYVLAIGLVSFLFALARVVDGTVVFFRRHSEDAPHRLHDVVLRNELGCNGDLSALDALGRFHDDPHADLYIPVPRIKIVYFSRLSKPHATYRNHADRSPLCALISATSRASRKLALAFQCSFSCMSASIASVSPLGEALRALCLSRPSRSWFVTASCRPVRTSRTSRSHRMSISM